MTVLFWYQTRYQNNSAMYNWSPCSYKTRFNHDWRMSRKLISKHFKDTIDSISIKLSVLCSNFAGIRNTFAERQNLQKTKIVQKKYETQNKNSSCLKYRIYLVVCNIMFVNTRNCMYCKYSVNLDLQNPLKNHKELIRIHSKNRIKGSGTRIYIG